MPGLGLCLRGEPPESWHSEVDVDLGITSFDTLSIGGKIQDPRHLHRRLEALGRNRMA